jgi:LysM repeat protein
VLGVVLLVLAVVLLTWFLWPDGDDTREAAPGGEGAPVAARGEAPGDAGEQTRRPTPDPTPRDPAPLGSAPAWPERPFADEVREAAEQATEGIEMGATLPTTTAPGPGETRADGGEADDATPPVNTSTDPGPLAVTGTAAPPPPPPTSPRRVTRRVETGLELIAQNRPVEARRLLSQTLASGSLGDADAELVRRKLAEVNERLVFGPEVVAGDPFALTYVVEPNDAMAKIPRKTGVHTDWRFIKRINRVADERKIRVGQRLKIVTGPFHAVISKRAYRLDLYMGDGRERVYVCSRPVGLGEFDSTPEGRFLVRPDSKLINPEWVNPRTRQRYRPDDPANPIGEHWIGLVGAEERLEGLEGYGIHGTIEPDSIGRQASMGCVRMLPDDVAIVWEVLMEEVSTVVVMP